MVKGAESKLNVKYSTLPVPFETQYSVLDTDYDSYSVVWSCSSIGPLRTRKYSMSTPRLLSATVAPRGQRLTTTFPCRERVGDDP